jgi:succinate dehydrogenase/fumarate reductase flavoprotein subunit
VTTDRIETDLLIIGGGSAGCYAAIKAKDEAPDLKVTIVEKGGDIKRAGTISFGMDGLNVCVVPGVHTAEEYVRHVVQDWSPLCNESAQQVLARDSFAILKELESWGVRFRKDAKGQYVVGLKGPFQVSYTNGHDLKPILAREVRRREVRVLDHSSVTRLFVEDGRVTGASVLGVRAERFTAISAKAVILAAGGCARLGLPASGYLFSGFDFPGNSGDAYAMAFHAGATLTGFEFTIGGNFGLPGCAKDHLSPLEVMLKYADGEIVNARGESVFGKKARERTSWIGGMDDFAETLRAEIDAGHDPLFLNVSHLRPGAIEEAKRIAFTSLRPSLKAFLTQRGLSFENDPIEIAARPMMLCGGHGATGIVVDGDAKTTVDGLFAAGDAAYVPLQSLTGAFVFGAIAGREAARYASSCEGVPRTPSEEVFAEEERRVLSPLQESRTLPASLFEYKMRRLVNEYVDSPRNARKLEIAQSWVDRLRGEDLPQLRAEDHHELSRAIEAENILDCVEMVVAAARERKESRRYGWVAGTHIRSDYPQTDDENWLKYLLINRDPESGQVRLRASTTLHGESA